MGKKSVLFICLGNICRSPMAEAVFAQLLKDRGQEGDWTVDSAATGDWHTGNGPDSRALKVLKVKGVNYTHVVRQVTKEDFSRFDFIFGMDNENIRTLRGICPLKECEIKIDLLGNHDPQKELIIRDPYYDSDDKGFYKCYDQCLRSCTGFLDKVSTGSS